MLDLLSDDARRDPFPYHAAARAASPLARDPRSGAWMIFDHEGVKRALFDHGAFRSAVRPPAGRAPDWLVFSDPPRHSKLRALVVSAFTPRMVAALEPRVRAISSELLDAVVDRGAMDLEEEYAGPLPALVIADLLGVPAADRPLLRRWSRAIMKLSYAVVGGPAAAGPLAEHASAFGEMSAYARELLRDRRASPREDLMTRLARAEVDGERLSDAEVLGFFQLLLAAGTETTTDLVDNAILCFLEHPEQRARLEGDPALLPSAIEEVLRYRSPAQVVFRETTRDVALHGEGIPSGSFVLAMVGSANRDPRAFPDPERFDVGRAPNPHLAFGHGIHFCLGAALARLEARVAIPDLLQRLPGLALAEDRPWVPRPALNVHGPASLPVRFTPGRR